MEKSNVNWKRITKKKKIIKMVSNPFHIEIFKFYVMKEEHDEIAGDVEKLLE